MFAVESHQALCAEAEEHPGAARQGHRRGGGGGCRPSARPSRRGRAGRACVCALVARLSEYLVERNAFWFSRVLLFVLDRPFGVRPRVDRYSFQILTSHHPKTSEKEKDGGHVSSLSILPLRSISIPFGAQSLLRKPEEHRAVSPRRHASGCVASISAGNSQIKSRGRTCAPGRAIGQRVVWPALRSSLDG
jgi:hypothetical protein